MTTTKTLRTSLLAHMVPIAINVAAVSAVALTLAGCKPGEEPGVHVASLAMIDSRERHPIVVSRQPANLSVRVAPGSDGMTPAQRAQVLDFLRNYRGTDRAGRLAIAVPSGGANEVAAIRVARDLRKLLNGAGIDDGQMAIRAYHAGHEANAAIRISYSRFVAEAPECRVWTENLANDPRNLPYPNLGCAQQRNLAAQIANPADLLEPRRMDPGSAERRDTVWEKYVKGEPTHAAKSQDERLQVQGAK